MSKRHDICFLPGNPPVSKFPLGTLIITPNAHRNLSTIGITKGIHRHASGDWGEVSEKERDFNDRALKEGLRIISEYDDDENGVRFWIITEPARNGTIVLLPEEY
jgi:hypothetical protein